MTRDQLRTLSFGDVGGRLWGAAICAPEPIVVLGDRDGSSLTRGPSEAAWGEDGREWRLTGEGLELQVAAGGEEPVRPATNDDSEPSGFQELCRVSGTVTLAGASRKVECVGTRCVIDGLDPGSLGSARAVSGWFGDADAFMLLALRASASTGHEQDLVAATLFDPEGWVPVADPRLSTTYAASGQPTRTSLELWIGNGESEYPRRAAGEATGPGAGLATDGVRLSAIPLRCHSRGREGAGVYVLAGF